MTISVKYVYVLCFTVIRIGQPQMLTNRPNFIPFNNAMYLPQQNIGISSVSRELTLEFLNLLELVNKLNYPRALIEVKNELRDQILRNELEVGRIMNYTKKLKFTSAIDKLIVTLFTLRDTLSESCLTRTYLRMLIVYSIINKDRFHSSQHPYKHICESTFPTYNPFCQNLCKNVKLLTYACGNRGRNPFYPNFLIQNPPANGHFNEIPLVTETAPLDRNISDIANQLANLLPCPNSELQKQGYNDLKNLLQSKIVYDYLNTLNVQRYDPQNLLNNVLQQITRLDVPQSILEAANDYLNHDENSSNDLRNSLDPSWLIEYLPEPITEEEEEYFKIATSFIQNSELYKIIQPLDLLKNPSEESYYTIILLLSESTMIDEEIANVFKFYRNYEDYEDLELNTKKVVLKTYRLFSIFKKVLNYHLLDHNITDKLKVLLRFLSKNSHLLNNFEISSDVQNRAQFVMSIMDYIAIHDEVPLAIKNIVQILKPYVIYTGEGAVLI